MKRTIAMLLAAVMALSLCACGAKEAEDTKSAGFEPRLDTEMTATLEIAGFMGNFEALDQAMNAFNEYYPNVEFLYDHNSAFMLPEYLENNGNTDIFMVDDSNLKRAGDEDYGVADRCLDLSQEDIDVSDVYPEAAADYTVDGQLLSLPIAMTTCGIVVNKTLLTNEGLSVPQNYEEFLSVLSALKEKGYAPLQGSEKHLYGELAANMVMNVLAEDKDVVSALLAGDESAVSAVLPVFERLEAVIENGYTDYDLNCTFPQDNYDGSIMAFFEGDMPFYVCNAECVSGMQKRESKSETFSANPFEYEFVYAPLGDEGAYGYTEPWYGFSVNKDSEEKDLAVEFLRFLMQPDRLDSMASIKGMPSAAIDGADERYSGIKNAENIQSSFSNDGSVPDTLRETFIQVCNDFGAGVYADANAAAEAYVQQCGALNA